MNSNTLTKASPARTASRPSLWRRPLISAFSHMKQGCLQLILPDGSLKIFGSPESPHKAVIQINSEAFFKRCVFYGDIGFAESYLDSEWETEDLTAVISWFIINLETSPGLSGSKAPRTAALNILRYLNHAGHWFSRNSKEQARRNIAAHYDLSNEFFSLFLDESMMYSSAKWINSDDTLENAQLHKNDALCRSLDLKTKDHVLEIGSGWGGWAIHAAKTYGCRVTSITLSEQQLKLATERVAEAGLSHLITFELRDYRDLSTKFDKLVSIEMMEAIGHSYLPQFCQSIDKSLKPNGIAALQFITCPDSHYEEMRNGVDFIQKHIFPGSLLLSLGRLNRIMQQSGAFLMTHIDDLGQDYAKTLRTWQDRFNSKLPAVKKIGFDDYFIRKWQYYLSYCEAAFTHKKISVVQAVYRRSTVKAI